MMSPADHIARLEYVVREQMTVIDQLRAENRRLLGWTRPEVNRSNPPVWRFPTNGASPPR